MDIKSIDGYGFADMSARADIEELKGGASIPKPVKKALFNLLSHTRYYDYDPSNDSEIVGEWLMPIVYPITAGTATFSDDSTITVTAKGHVSVSLASNRQSTTGQTFMSVYDVTDNSANRETRNNIDNKSKKFTIPAGAEIVIKYKNIDFSFPNYTGSGEAPGITISTRKANSQDVIMSGVSFGPVQTTGKTLTADDVERTATASSDIDFGEIALLISGIALKDAVGSFDIEIWVDGERWV